MQIVQVSRAEKLTEILAALKPAALELLGHCAMDRLDQSELQLLVVDASLALQALNENGIEAKAVDPPLPLTDSAILWWQQWRRALDQETYLRLREQHHPKTRSEGTIIRIHERDFPAGGADTVEPWSVLADHGVDVRCEFHCDLPTGLEVHLLVPDAEKANSVLVEAGFSATDVDYQGPEVRQGISWWGQWKPALAFANKVKRPLLMSFASPRVEQVPGLW